SFDADQHVIELKSIETGNVSTVMQFDYDNRGRPLKARIGMGGASELTMRLAIIYQGDNFSAWLGTLRIALHDSTPEIRRSRKLTAVPTSSDVQSTRTGLRDNHRGRRLTLMLPLENYAVKRRSVDKCFFTRGTARPSGQPCQRGAPADSWPAMPRHPKSRRQPKT